MLMNRQHSTPIHHARGHSGLSITSIYAEMKLYIVVFSYPGDLQRSMSDAKLLKECRLRDCTLLMLEHCLAITL